MAKSHITEFIQSLNKEEIKIIKENIHQSNGNEGLVQKSKLKKLFDILTNETDRSFSDKELSKIFKCQEGAIRVSKSRLFDKVKEILVLDKHFENVNVFNYRERIMFTLRKKILLIKSLYRTLNKGRLETINLLLNETIKLAKENEVFDILVEALSLQKYIRGFRTGVKEFENIDTQIIFYDYCFKCVQAANDKYYRLILNQEFITLFSEKEIEIQLQLSIKQMHTDFQKTNAQEINYYMHILKTALFERKKDFHLAIADCKKIISILKENRMQYSKDRAGSALANLSLFNVYINNYSEAVLYAKKALEFHPTDSMNYLITKEQLFHSYLYAGNYKEAINCIQWILEHLTSNAGAYRKSKFIYYNACVLFATNQFKEALQLLNKSLEIEKDKANFNISLRILITMIFIKLNKLKEASNSIVALQKHIQRTRKTKEVKQRDVLIVKLLAELEKDKFQQNEKSKTFLKLMAELSDKDKSTAWNYYTPELIPFHEWVKKLPEKSKTIINS